MYALQFRASTVCVARVAYLQGKKHLKETEGHKVKINISVFYSDNIMYMSFFLLGRAPFTCAWIPWMASFLLVSPSAKSSLYFTFRKSM